MVVSKKFIYAKKFVGDPTPDNFRLESEELPALKDGEILCKAIYLSVDPFMRPYMMRYPEKSLMIGGQVAKIMESKNPAYPVGAHVTAYFGWRTHTIVKPIKDDPTKGMDPSVVTLLPDFKSLPLSLAIGYLGMPGATSYFGFLEICKPKAGEVVVVTGAAGAVGSLVGQIAKIKGCKVIGYAGSDDKCDWLKNELGFDYALNYKNVDITKSLEEAAPDGVDCYFDNVGGEISSAIINKMRYRGRISVCGSVAAYNDTEVRKAAILQPAFVSNQLSMEGFSVFRWTDRYSVAFRDISEWIKDGKLVKH